MNILLHGSGNVATHLALAIHKTGHQIVQVYSRTKASAAALGNRLGVPYTHLVDEIMQDADLYIYAVSDDALESLVSLNIAPQAMHVHTAGSVAMDIFKGYKKHYGVLYPLQSLSKDKTVDFQQVPLLLEASDEVVKQALDVLAKEISGQVHHYNTEQRLKIHLAAVFANNFVNHLFHIASDIMESSDIDFNLLKPLIKETIEKISHLSPAEAQTGPAKRNDQKIMKQHMEMLKDQPKLQNLYRELSQMILEQYLHQS
ncbi:MAG: Rossmann-like and DUF2520 domain-containing protein [Paludibacter sp.]|jgi:predicted short-subunit dehydrogenase-like oxidoreductase (DUF2520 family)|nr:DUF2520 domain-containing protein [Bacteroidales bacterium]